MNDDDGGYDHDRGRGCDYRCVIFHDFAALVAAPLVVAPLVDALVHALVAAPPLVVVPYPGSTHAIYPNSFDMELPLFLEARAPRDKRIPGFDMCAVMEPTLGKSIDVLNDHTVFSCV